MNTSGYGMPRPKSGQSRNGRVIRPESGVYSEVQDVRKAGDERSGYDPQEVDHSVCVLSLRY